MITERNAQGEAVAWDHLAPRGAPFQRSGEFRGLRATGRFRLYEGADTWYPAWAADGRLYSPYTDGQVEGIESWSVDREDGPAVTGNATIDGDDPLDLRLRSLGAVAADPAPWEGRYPSACLHVDGAWYVGTYCLRDGGRGINWDVLGPFVGFRVSLDGGATWTETPHSPARPIFGEHGTDDTPIRFGAPHIIDLGRDQEHSDNGYVYLVGHGSHRSTEHTGWCSGDGAYLARTRPAPDTINDPASWEFAAGTEPQPDERIRTLRNGPFRWSSRVEDARPIVWWPGHVGCVTVTWHPGIDRFLMCITDGWPGIHEMDSYILESDRLEGPWRSVAYLESFGQQAYFLTIPSKFIDHAAGTFWLAYSANFTNTFLPTRITADPSGSAYGLNLLELQLVRS